MEKDRVRVGRMGREGCSSGGDLEIDVQPEGCLLWEFPISKHHKITFISMKPNILTDLV